MLAQAFDRLVDSLPVVGFVILGAGYLVGTWRRGKNDAARDAIELATGEVALLKGARERDLGALHVATNDIARLEGTVAQLRVENAELRSLVMLDTVPPALSSALAEIVSSVLADVNQIHRETREALVDHFDHQLDQNRIYWTEQVSDKLHPIEQGIARLLAEGPKEGT